MSKSPSGQRIEVTLLKAHEHSGVVHSAGDKILVTAVQRDWLAAQHIIEAPATAKESK